MSTVVHKSRPEIIVKLAVVKVVNELQKSVNFERYELNKFGRNTYTEIQERNFF